MSLNQNDFTLMASLLDEAAAILAKLPEELAERLQVRHFLADELQGSAIMLREHAVEQST